MKNGILHLTLTAWVTDWSDRVAAGRQKRSRKNARQIVVDIVNMSIEHRKQHINQEATIDQLKERSNHCKLPDQHRAED